jgi:hypothetical protein
VVGKVTGVAELHHICQPDFVQQRSYFEFVKVLKSGTVEKLDFFALKEHDFITKAPNEVAARDEELVVSNGRVRVVHRKDQALHIGVVLWFTFCGSPLNDVKVLVLPGRRAVADQLSDHDWLVVDRAMINLVQ